MNADESVPAGPGIRPWRRLASRTIVEDRWISLAADRCETAHGRIIDPFYVLMEHDWVHVVAIDARGRVAVVRQYRYACDVVSLELPGGLLDTNEDPLAAARRELREETGFEADEWQFVGSVYPNPARIRNRQYCYIATGLRQVGGQQLDHAEEIEVAFLPFGEIPARIASGEFCQGLHIASVYMALAHLGRGIDRPEV